MSNLVNKLFGELKRMGSEIGAEASRLGKQGANELASVLFNGSAFVQYGTGQETKEAEKQPEVERENDNSIER
jgi:hypothetical protein